jgi:hypothetical protein
MPSVGPSVSGPDPASSSATAGCRPPGSPLTARGCHARTTRATTANGRQCQIETRWNGNPVNRRARRKPLEGPFSPEADPAEDWSPPCGADLLRAAPLRIASAKRAATRQKKASHPVTLRRRDRLRPYLRPDAPPLSEIPSCPRNTSQRGKAPGVSNLCGPERRLQRRGYDCPFKRV